MAEYRERPYSNFNFLVDVGLGDAADSIKAGFQEVSGLNVEVTMAEYRVGSERTNHVRKISGMHKIGDVTLKRGLIGATDLVEWLSRVRDGEQTAAHTVTIQLQDESHGTVMTWTLGNARPMKYTAPTFNAKGGTDVAIEELVLSCEDLTVS